MSFEPRIAPSILSADIAYLARDLERISHADLIHVATSRSARTSWPPASA